MGGWAVTKRSNLGVVGLHGSTQRRVHVAKLVTKELHLRGTKRHLKHSISCNHDSGDSCLRYGVLLASGASLPSRACSLWWCWSGSGNSNIMMLLWFQNFLRLCVCISLYSAALNSTEVFHSVFEWRVTYWSLIRAHSCKQAWLTAINEKAPWGVPSDCVSISCCSGRVAE